MMLIQSTYIMLLDIINNTNKKKKTEFPPSIFGSTKKKTLCWKSSNRFTQQQLKFIKTVRHATKEKYNFKIHRLIHIQHIYKCTLQKTSRYICLYLYIKSKVFIFY